MKKTLSFALALLCCIASQAAVFISDLYVATGNTESEAKQAMADAGYTVIDRNVNRNGGGKYVYIGFKATTKKSEALTDVVIVPKSGAKVPPKTLSIAGKVYTKMGYNADAGDLNAGRTGADVLLLYASKTGNSSASTPVVNGVYVESSASLISKAEYAGLYSSGTIQPSADLNAGGTATEHHYFKMSKHTCDVNYSKTATSHSGTCKECSTVFTSEDHTFAWRDNSANNLYNPCQQYCTTCGYLNAAQDHDQAGFAPISADNAGWHFITCSKCGMVVTSAPHILTITDVEGDDESHHGSCSKCHWEGPIAHSYGECKDNPTTHKHVATCSVCWHVKSQDHDFSKYEAHQNVGHMSICSVCGAKGEFYEHHKVVDIPARAATCTTPGITEAWHCSDCYYSMSNQTIPSLGHVMTSVDPKESTCYEPGNVAYYHCSRCSQDYQYSYGGQVALPEWIVLPAHHNTPIHNEAKEADCTHDGNLENWYCSACDNYFTSESLAEDTKTTAQAVLLPVRGHDFADNNGFCLVCQTYEPAMLNEADDMYEISNGGQLCWYAELCNAGSSKSARLTADVRVNPHVLGEDGKLDASTGSLKAWTPIKDFAGTFDGCGHTISGLYYSSSSSLINATRAGLFYKPQGTARILNTTLADSYLSSYWGATGIASDAQLGCYIYNCHNGARVYATNNGAAGISLGKATVENCTNQGSIEAASNASGIGGYQIISCANTGVVTANMQAAGICYNMESDGYIKNCYNTGMVSTKRSSIYDNEQAYAICYATYSSTVIANCYALEGGPSLTMSGRKINLEYKTAAEFRSGEVCSLLNVDHPAGTQVWRQNIYVDKVPLLQGPEVTFDENKQRYVNKGLIKTIGTLTHRVAELTTGDFTLPETKGLEDTILER